MIHVRRDLVAAATAGLVPFLAVGFARHLAGISGPAEASAETAMLAEEDESIDPREHPDRAEIHARVAVVERPASPSDPAVPLTRDLFPPAAEAASEPAPVAVQGPDGLRSGQTQEYGGQYKVTSLMAARGGAVAVVDRKMRRVGEDVGSGVVVESIDLEARVVVLVTPDGTRLERRAHR